jgi:hypothetical protein
VHALEIGADDYLVKPFSMKELVARVAQRPRRGGREQHEERGEPIEIEELRIDPLNVQAYLDGESAELTPTEFRSCTPRARARPRRQPRRATAEALGPPRRAPRPHRRRLRAQAARQDRSQGDAHTFIQTRYGVGYKLEPEPKVSARVAWISRCPVKGLAITQLDECELTEAGVAGDREFFLVDENDRLVNSKGLGALQQIVPSYDDDAGALTLVFPDGTTVSEQLAFDGSLEAGFWSRVVDVRVVDGPWSEAISEFAAATCGSSDLRARRPDRMRSGAATLLGTGSLRAMARILGVDEVDGRRFRMNFGIDGLREHEEDEWLGRACGSAKRSSFRRKRRPLRGDDAEPDTGAPDLDTLKALPRTGQDPTQRSHCRSASMRQSSSRAESSSATSW